MTLTAETLGDTSWQAGVEEFVTASPWLGAADMPQVKAMHAIAKQLDGGKFQAALISQYTLIHARLMARNPVGKQAETGDPNMLDVFLEGGGTPENPEWHKPQ